MKLAYSLALALFFFQTAAAQQVTGLAGWNIYLDPGHSQRENVGIFGYSEAEKVLRVGLALREMLLAQTDIDTVYISRTNEQQSVSLVQRVDHANSVAAAHFHSIHSNAAGPTANSLFVLWPQYRDGSEAEPNGGRRMSNVMAERLARGMRIPNLGGIGECDFYGTASCRDRSTAPKGSRNYVQSFTLMASELSEAGFHTNPVQNQRNMNAEWKRLEAQAMFWSILDYHGLPRPAARIATGIVSDVESGLPINGATVTVGPKTYTTDTYASLFHRYSNDPDELRNGFYYLEDLPAGTHPVTVTADQYQPYSGSVTMVDTFFTVHDVQLVSTVPPTVAGANVAAGQTGFRITDPLVFTFSRPVERASAEAAFSISPVTEGTFRWAGGDRQLTFVPDTLLPQTDYTVTIGAGVQGAYGHAFDGNGDGTAGDAYAVSFRTGFPDTAPPRLVASTPRPNATDVDVRPIVTVTFNEVVEPASLEGRISLQRAEDGFEVPGTVAHYAVGEQSVVSFFPQGELAAGKYHTLVVAPGVRDRFGNEGLEQKQVRFSTGDTRFTATLIDDFEGDVPADWWAPQQSGSTTGIVTDSTHRAASDSVVSLLSGGTGSLELRYGWDTTAAEPLVRLCFSGCAPSEVRFDDSYLLQAYVFGDGSGNRFRFAVDDRVSTGGGTIEVSPWYAVDWIGWRLVSWDIGADGTGDWIGDGTPDGTLSFESIQLTHTPGSPAFGTFYVDDLRIAKREAVSVGSESEGRAPGRLALHPNRPNPFGSATVLSFELPAPAEVHLRVYSMTGALAATLVAGKPMPAGAHTVTWDASGLPSGVYICRIDAGGEAAVRKLTLVR